jgi:predicted DNA-binding transcriptional regulator AlpA
MPKFITSKEVAKMLGLSVAWCEYHRWKGDGIPFTKFGRTVRYSEDDVLAWIDSHSAQLNTCISSQKGA